MTHKIVVMQKIISFYNIDDYKYYFERFSDVFIKDFKNYLQIFLFVFCFGICFLRSYAAVDDDDRDGGIGCCDVCGTANAASFVCSLVRFGAQSCLFLNIHFLRTFLIKLYVISNLFLIIYI